MRVLVLGSAGQIGKPLCEYLTSHGHEVVTWDIVDSDFQDLTHEDDIDHLNWVHVKENFDKVIFLAFKIGGSKYLANQDKTFDFIQHNVLIMANTFSLLRGWGIPFLFASSQMSNMHHTNYGFLKDLGERYCRTLDNAWICRFWNVYGVEEDNEKAHVISDFIRMARDEGRIRMRTDGKEERQFLYVEDACNALTQWVNDEWDDRTQYYDITSFRWNSIFDVADFVASYHGVEIVAGETSDAIQAGIKNEPDPYILKFWKPNNNLGSGIRKVMQELP